MNKPKSLRMKMHEANRPPEYLQAYIATEMDEYLEYLEESNARYTEAVLTRIRDFPKIFPEVKE
jgi:hypothetical protein